ncbi:MAG: L,D-transpeptidase family protein [Saprospiraceae bacterium]|nr:L,D-transpeptidase family protein [Saprospiraceae bacterium]
MENEKVLADEERKKTELEAQKIKEENKKALAEVQRMENEKVLADEQRKETELEAQKIKEENKKALAEFQKNKEEKEKALAEVQRMKNEKVLADEERKKTELEAQKIKEENKKALAEVQRIKNEKVLADEERKKTELEAQKIKEEKSSQKLNELDNFKNLVIKVDSVKNIMFLKGENSDGKIIDIKTYKVSTAKTSIKKPLGIGSITSISLNPQWNPTTKTLKAFREKGINLPSVVPFGNKLNYMGAAKINLTHKVNGQQVYRIHGTLSENTIGTNESAGCIRMKNKEVVELATLLEKFSKIKSFNNISVILE